MEEIIYEGSWERVDSRLTKHFSYSRNFFQHIIETDRIHVKSSQRDRFSPKKSYNLQQNDIVRIGNLERFLDGWILEECPALEILITPSSQEIVTKTSGGVIDFLAILHETDDYMVIYKPKWVLSHPGSIWDVHQPSVVGWLFHYFQKKDLPSMGSFIRAGLIHRLDKETDGLMLIAKSEKGLTHFKSLFQQKSWAETIEEKERTPLKKFYRATCIVSPEGKEFLATIENELPHYIEEIVLAKLPHAKEPKIGITKILSFQREEDNRAHIEVEILTWRTHQIRYHLSHHGLPIEGDYLYGQKEEWVMLQLTAWKLIFEDISGDTQTFTYEFL